MSKPVFENAAALLAASGTPLGNSEWVLIDQGRVNQFADATDDHQWIHVDVERARQSDFGGTIAHGFLTLSMLARFLPEMIDVRFRHGINYGCEKVRFLSPVKVGSRIRGSGEITQVEATRDSGVQVSLRLSVEIEGASKPACVAEWINRYYF